MPKFAANLSFLFQELEFLDRFEAARRQAFRRSSICFPTISRRRRRLRPGSTITG